MKGCGANMVDELRVEERLIEEAIELVEPGGEQESRLLYHLLVQLREMGYRHRAIYRVVLFNEDADADFNEDYAAYLDKRACREDATWPLGEEE
ncbi:MAG TPA: hypothetical protein EYO31_03320 [Phycisphaerales bacterium]|nr:hypothetical protein [Phycisphaerales bacterium]